MGGWGPWVDKQRPRGAQQLKVGHVGEWGGRRLGCIAVCSLWECLQRLLSRWYQSRLSQERCQAPFMPAGQLRLCLQFYPFLCGLSNNLSKQYVIKI